MVLAVTLAKCLVDSESDVDVSSNITISFELVMASTNHKESLYSSMFGNGAPSDDHFTAVKYR